MPDSSKVAKHFGRKAHEYVAHARVQEKIAADLLARIPRHAFVHALDLGCGPGVNFFPLREKALMVTGIDISPEMCRTANELLIDGTEAVTANIEEYSGTGCDLVFSSLALQWCDLKRFWRNFTKTYPQHVFLALAIPVAGTLPELRQILTAAGIEGRVNTFMSGEEIRNLCAQYCGASMVSGLSWEERVYADEFTDISQFLQSIRGIGANCTEEQRPLSRGQYRAFMQVLEEKLKNDGKLVHTYRVLVITGMSNSLC